jgi:hypothetical protein
MSEELRKCSMCLQELPKGMFGNHSKGREGLRSRCKACNRVEARQTYQRNPAPYKARARAFSRTQAGALKSWLNQVKAEHGCCVCGEADPVVLDFHHVQEKDLAVTTAVSKGVTAVERELRKCVVLCANDHRRVHAGVIDVSQVPTVSKSFARSENRRTHKP